jgi:hypothetical protein
MLGIPDGHQEKRAGAIAGSGICGRQHGTVCNSRAPATGIIVTEGQRLDADAT